MMKYEPLVTIIIPLYNGSNYISEAIECALNQTYSKIEIIVVNDGSVDNGDGERIALSYQDKIRYYSKKNGGVSSAINYAMERMNGEWFSWLSHDDLYALNKVERQVDYLNKLKRNGIDINNIFVHCNACLIDYKGKEIHKLIATGDGLVETKKIILQNLNHNQLGGCSFILPKNVCERIGLFDEKIRTISDFDYWYRMLFNGYELYQMKDSLVKYRVHKSQVTYKMSDVGNKEINDFYIWTFQQMCLQKNSYILKDLCYVGYCAGKKKYKSALSFIEGYIRQHVSKGYYRLRWKPILAAYRIIGGGERGIRRLFNYVKVR